MLCTGPASSAALGQPALPRPEVTPCCCHRVTNVAPQLDELCSQRIWPRPKEGADSIALLGAGLPGSQAQGQVWPVRASYRLGPGLVTKGARAPDAVCSWSHSLSQAGSQENRELREGVSPLPWALFCSQGESKQGTHQPRPSTHTQQEMHMEKDSHTELTLGRQTHRHSAPRKLGPNTHIGLCIIHTPKGRHLAIQTHIQSYTHLL